MDEATISIWHWLVVILWVTANAIPAARILARLGFSRWFAVLAFVPIINIVALWILAYVRWPERDSRV